jgi:sugar-specific transcriptional regulator TrmB
MMANGSTGDLQWLASILGLSEPELRAYRFLHRTGGAAAGAVASEVGLPRGRIYELLRGLAERGLVRELPGPRIHYVPIPLAEVFSTIRMQTTQQLQLLEQAEQRLPTRPRSPIPAGARTRPGDVSVFHGRRAVEAEVRRLLDRAQDQFLLAGTVHLAERLASLPETLAALALARQRGVDLALYVPDLPDESAARDRIARAAGEDHLHLAPIDSLPTVTLVVADGVALLVVVQPLDGSPLRGDDVGIRIEGRAVVETFRRRFDHFPGALASSAGLVEAYLQMMGSARRDVVGMGPREWPRTLEAARARLEPATEAARARGVRLRALTEPAGDEDGAIAGAWDMRTMPAVPVWILIVDGAELCQAFPSRHAGGTPSVRRSRDPTEIRYWLEWFETWWAQARLVKQVQP